MEIIPKQTPQFPQWLNFLFYLSLILLIFVIVAFFIVNNSIKNSQKTLEDLKESLAKERTAEKLDLEKEILSYQKKINGFSQLIGQHLEPSEVFAVIQKNCHPKVWFQQFNLDSRQGAVIVSGETQSFESLGQQILIFKEENLIKTVSLEKASITKEGKINFNLSLLLNPAIFK